MQIEYIFSYSVQNFPILKFSSFLFSIVFWNPFKNIFISFQDEIHVEENVPWGEDTLFTLEFREEANKYSIHTCNNMYLQKDGKLAPTLNNVR